MSPEQAGLLNRSLDYRTDFYSLGVVFYHLLMGTDIQAEDTLALLRDQFRLIEVFPLHVGTRDLSLEVYLRE